MADYTHTIDRWDEATGKNAIEQIASVGELSGRAGDLPCGRATLAQGQDHAAQPGAGDRTELAGLVAGQVDCIAPLFPHGTFQKLVRFVHAGSDCR